MRHLCIIPVAVSVVQLLSHVRLFVTPMDCSVPGLLSFTVSWSCTYSCPLSQWCYLTISSSSAPFSFWLQSFPVSGSFPVSRLFRSGGQNIEGSVSASVLLMNIFNQAKAVFIYSCVMTSWFISGCWNLLNSFLYQLM